MGLDSRAHRNLPENCKRASRMEEAKYPPVNMDHNWLYVTLIEERLSSALKSAPTFEEIDGLIKQVRTACENIIFFDFPYAVRKNCERHLWDCHTLINNRYRKLVEAHKKSDQKKLTVERRKLEKRYAEFIKGSQHFYKSFIQRLASQYPGNYGLRRIANRLQLGTLSVEEGVALDSDMKQKLELSCYTTLLRLGDLSRYRNSLRTKDSSWATAVGYYQLAHDLLPELGSAHNQLAVIANYEADHLTAVYHNYRGVTAIEPLKDHENNLEIAFNKIISGFAKNKSGSQPKTDSIATLTNWFTLLHAKFYHGVEFPTQKELENEILTRLSLLLKDQNQNIDEVLDKLVLINIAAEYFASKKMTGNNDPKANQTFAFTLQFNLRFMNTLLQVLLPELEGPGLGEDIPNAVLERPTERITTTCRRILPVLRQYSVWLTTRARIITNFAINGTEIQFEGLRVRIFDMWKSHASVLSKLLDYFNGSDLKPSPYLLEEDEATVGFKPFHSRAIPAELKIYFDVDGNHKPRVTDQGIQRSHPNIEMQSRVFDILIIGNILSENADYPLTFSPQTQGFIFDEAALVHISIASPTFSASSSHQGLTPSRQQNISKISQPLPIQRAQTDGRCTPESTYSSQSNNIEAQMSAMVQKLVDGKCQQRELESDRSQDVSNESSYGMHSETVQDVFGHRGTHSLCHITPKKLPRIPGFDGTFAPMPNELSPTSPGRRFTADQAPISNYANAEGRLAAAKELERITGYTQHPSWNPSLVSRNPKEMPFGPYYSDYNLKTVTDFDGSSINFSTPALTSQQKNTKPNQLVGRNDSTIYAGASNFENETVLRSSPWANGRPGFGTPYTQTPPAAQGRQGD